MPAMRIYRAAFALSFVAIAVAMFSLKPLPPPKATPLAPDAFDPVRSARVLTDLAQNFPNRQPGQAGDSALANVVGDRFLEFGYTVSRQDFAGRFKGAAITMTNVIGTLPGDSDHRLLIVAPRDSLDVSGDPEAVAPTAVLLELARVFKRVAHEDTLMLVSSDGSTTGAAGARELADEMPAGGPIDAAIVVGGYSPEHGTAPQVVPWGNRPVRSGPRLERTVERALAMEAGKPPTSYGLIGQMTRLAFPLSLTEQAPLVDAGYPAVTLSAGDHGSAEGTPAKIADMVVLGKSTLSSALALDKGDVEEPPRAYVALLGQLLPAWAVRLVVIALLFPILAVAADTLMRAARRRLRPGMWAIWVVAASTPFLVSFLYAYLFDRIGLLPSVPSYPFDPAIAPFTFKAGLAIFALGCVVVVTWLVVAKVAPGGVSLRSDRNPYALGARSGVVVVLAALILAAWFWNPFGAALLLPAAHLWTPALIHEPRWSLRLTLPMIAGGLVLPVLPAIYYSATLGLGADFLYYALLLVSGGAIGFWIGVFACLIAGTFVCTVAVVVARHKAADDEEPVAASERIRGPVSYAGPGSLGGTPSALR